MPEISEADLASLNEAKTELTTLKTEMGGLKGKMDGLEAAKVDLEHKLDDADQELLSETYLDYKSHKPSNSNSSNRDGVGDGEFDFERASGKEIATHLSGKSKRELEAALKGVNDRIGKTEEQMGRAFAQLDVTLTALRNPDFDANKEAIYKIAKDNPSWGAERCYKQWKLEHKDEVDKQAADVKRKAEEERKALSEKGDGVPLSVTQDKQLTKEEAASLAYDKAFGNSEKA